MIPRLLAGKLAEAAGYYPITTLTGPRQSGKTTLIRSLWPEKGYASLEDPDSLDFALSDPRSFLEQGGPPGLIIDEAQRAPALFNYLQGYADRSPNGRYVVSGSNNFLLLEKVSQSLAGRSSVFHLLPFSGEELGLAAIPDSWEDLACKGFYPRVWSQGLPADRFARDYLATYVERDLRLAKNIADLAAFRRFLEICAGRTGQLLNLASLASDTGIAVNTARGWLCLLEAAWLVFLLRPWHTNQTKRLVKSPKLYWHDSSILCHLLGIRRPADLRSHPLRGSVFENLLIAERYKHASHRGEEPRLHFWRDSVGREVDLLEGEGDDRLLWEYKSGATIARDYFKTLELVGTEEGIPPERRMLVFGGDEAGRRSAGLVIGWRSAIAGKGAEG